MQKLRLLFGLAFVCSSLGLTSCYNEPEFANTPNLTFREIEQRTLRTTENVLYDSLIIVTRFQDGDGNLGLSETIYPEDIRTPFAPKEPYYNNFFCTLYKKVNGNFQKVLSNALGQPLILDGRFPRVSTDAREEPLEGDIRYSLRVFNDPNYPVKSGDTIRFEVKVVDRALNESPTVTTSEVVLFSQQ